MDVRIIYASNSVYEFSSSVQLGFTPRVKVGLSNKRDKT